MSRAALPQDMEITYKVNPYVIRRFVVAICLSLWLAFGIGFALGITWTSWAGILAGIGG